MQSPTQLTYTGQTEGGALTDATLAEIIQSATVPLGPGNAGLTALAGGAQAGATPLQLGINSVTIVVTAGDSVLLPPATPGAIVVLLNAAANSLNAFAFGATDVINALANATALACATGVTLFFCATAGHWRSK
jgi:hypothetical protein